MASRRTARKSAASQTPPLPAVGVVVELTVPDRARAAWPTRVEAVEGWSLVVIAPLRPDGEPWPVAAGSPVAIGWPTELGYLEATGSLRGADRDVVVTWHVDVERVERRQRRGAYRLPHVATVTLRVAGRGVTAITRDIGEGGLRCLLPDRDAPEAGTAVELELPLPDGEPVAGSATVVRRGEPRDGEVELVIAYRGLDASRSEELRRFIFAEQLRQRGAASWRR